MDVIIWSHELYLRQSHMHAGIFGNECSIQQCVLHFYFALSDRREKHKCGLIMRFAHKIGNFGNLK